MPIPSQNEILVPFLETLRDGQPHTRSQIIFDLAKRFNLTHEELNDTSGQHFTIINRVGWCDAYFNKAGFISKEKHPKNNMEDVFRITITGQNQLSRHAGRIDVAYLQSFYQGKVYRGAGSSDTTSDAELDLFDKFNKLPAPFQAFHSITWVGQGNRTVGEIDFLIAHPDYGILVLEVKGGDISAKGIAMSGTLGIITATCMRSAIPVSKPSVIAVNLVNTSAAIYKQNDISTLYFQPSHVPAPARPNTHSREYS